MTSNPLAPATGGDVLLRIDRLTVEGVGPADARRLGAALERRLGTLLAERGVPAGLRHEADRAVLGLGDLDLPVDRLPERAGEALAERLYRRLERPAANDPREDRR